MAEKACVRRLQKEFKDLLKEPVPHVLARPSPSNMLDWHFVFEGIKGTPFEGGVYHGKLKFPSDFPFKPPGIRMITPNGRFDTKKSICMSMSDFHPETWNPLWGVSSILAGLLSFMVENRPGYGSVTTTYAVKKKLASSSLAFNAKSAVFREMFPEYVEKHLERPGVSELEAEKLQSQRKSPAVLKQPASNRKSPEILKRPASQEVLEAEKLQSQRKSPAVLKQPASNRRSPEILKQPASQEVAAGSGNGIPLKKGPRQKKPQRFGTWLRCLLGATKD